MDSGQAFYLIVVIAAFSIFGSVLAIVHWYERRGAPDFEAHRKNRSQPEGTNKLPLGHQLAA